MSSLPLTAAIDRYVASVEGAGYSTHTLKAYSTRLNDFASWVGNQADAAVPAESIQSYLASLRRRQVGRRVGVSPSTLAHAFAILSGFFRYCERTLRIEPNPMRDVIKPRAETSVDEEFHSLTARQLDDLLHVAGNGWPSEMGSPDLRTANRRAQDRLAIALMGLAGLRVSEVCNIDRSDISGDLVTIVGKGRKRRSVPLAEEILHYMAEYEPPADGRHLFGMASDPSRRLTTNALEQRIPQLARRAGIFELRVTPHVLRHTFGSLMLAADPTALIPTRDLMGHESVETTNKYAHTREESRRLAIASMQEMRRRGRP